MPTVQVTSVNNKDVWVEVVKPDTTDVLVDVIKNPKNIVLEFNPATDADVDAHEAELDPHPQYATDTDLTSAVNSLTTAINTHTQAASTITDFSEAVDDRVATLIQPGTNISVNYDDGSNIFSISTPVETAVIASRNFSFNDITILPIGTVSERVLKTLIIIDTAFDDPIATLSIGDSIDNQRLQTIYENAPDQSGIYTSSPGYKYLISTVVNLYISPAGSSAGQGVVYLLRN